MDLLKKVLLVGVIAIATWFALGLAPKLLDPAVICIGVAAVCFAIGMRPQQAKNG